MSEHNYKSEQKHTPGDLSEKVRRLVEDNRRLSEELAEKDRQMQVLMNSWSWMITAPFRSLLSFPAFRGVAGRFEIPLRRAAYSFRNGAGKSRCNICGNDVDFADIDPARPRESFRCPVCDSSSRNRFLAHVLGAFFGYGDMPLAHFRKNRGIKIFEASGVARYCSYLFGAFDYINAQYDPDALKKPDFDRRKYADLQNLHYADESFHAVITSDVFEHVRLHEQALKEVYRVLRPDGLFFLQIPFVHKMEKTVTRVEIKGDKDFHVLPPVYHGGHTLVYRDYGRDLLDLMKHIGFKIEYLEMGLPQYGVPRQNIIIGGKGPDLKLPPGLERAG